MCDVLTGEFSVEKKMLIARAEEHTWDNCVGKEIEVYQEVLQSHNNER